MYTYTQRLSPLKVRRSQQEVDRLSQRRTTLVASLLSEPN